LDSSDLSTFFVEIKKDSSTKLSFLKSLLYFSYLNGRNHQDQVFITTINNFLLELDNSDYRALKQIQRQIHPQQITLQMALQAFNDFYDILPSDDLKMTFYELTYAFVLTDDSLEIARTYFDKILARNSLEINSRLRRNAREYIAYLTYLAKDKLNLEFKAV